MLSKDKYISANSVLTALLDNVTEMESDSYYGSNPGIPEDNIEDIMQSIPTANVEPIIYASWQEKKVKGVWYDYCSNCGECKPKINTDGSIPSRKRCGCCGAHMTE